MKTLSLLTLFVCIVTLVFAQNIGVGTNAPQEKLHVAGNMRVNNDFIAYYNGVLYDSLVVGNLAGAANARVRVVGGKTQTDVLTAGGEGFLNKMFSVYGNAQISGNTLISSLNTTGSGTVAGNARIDGRIGINGATSPSYGLLVNNANSYFQGDALVTGNKRINGRVGINGATHGSYGLIVNDANSYLQGSATVLTDAVVNGNTRIDGRFGINGYTHASYGLMVNNAHSFFQGNLTVSGDLNVSGTSNLTAGGSVSSNGNSSIQISFIQYHVNAVLLGNDDRNELINLPEFGPNIDDIRVSVFQYVDAYNDQWYSNPQDFRWWISNVNPDNNTAYIRLKNLAPYGVALRGDFYILIMIRN
jgi:hypothetical protein